MQIQSNTVVLFPGGELSHTSPVLAYKKISPRQVLFITKETPFHPVNYQWPDQPSDKGIILIQDQSFLVVQCQIAAMHKNTQELVLGEQIKEQKIIRHDPNWFFLVAHIVESDDLLNTDLDKILNQFVYLEVDATYRMALSKSHTACHLAALALNKCTAEFWTKPAEKIDSLGNPNLDALAVIDAKISEEYSKDHYRCGKSLRKSGFDQAIFFANLSHIQKAINKQLDEWCNHSKGLAIHVTPEKSYIDEKREWVCLLPNGITVRIPCGGTHIKTITLQNKITVNLERHSDTEFIMHSRFFSFC